MMTFVVASSMAWTASAMTSSEAPAATAASRTNARTSATRASSAGRVSARVSASAPTTRARPCSGKTGVVRRGALDELAMALAPGELAVADHDGAAAQHDVGPALDLAALVARVIDVHVVGLRRDRPL